ncbi:AP-5 complex subunit sigma-1 isoform X2 [Ochotona curzoniae]|uniref:AP-5 complex subunit sigma-1 isoform X2 n=1 Tax=Ochotona curzoniae TaxID=130825 RepID=UPI001B34728F|nr:AP-5 complex subunit sigma-1 isoform X2 [Ochotona curzoniae]
MVHAFLIHTVRASDAGLCRVLYSRVFGAEDSAEDWRPRAAGADRLLRKEQMLAVARWTPCANCSSRHLAGPPRTFRPKSPRSQCSCPRPHLEPSAWRQGTLSWSGGQCCGWVCCL